MQIAEADSWKLTCRTVVRHERTKLESAGELLADHHARITHFSGHGGLHCGELLN